MTWTTTLSGSILDWYGAESNEAGGDVETAIEEARRARAREVICEADDD